jgi:hypothetical protein
MSTVKMLTIKMSTSNVDGTNCPTLIKPNTTCLSPNISRGHLTPARGWQDGVEQSQHCHCQVGILEVDILEVGILEVGILEVGILEVGILEVDILKVHILEVDILEVDILEVGILEVDILEVGIET